MKGSAARHVYILESDTEFERLELQSTFPKYDYRKELEMAGLPFYTAKTVLDAGCGSGVVSRHVASRFPAAQVIGCDLAGERLKRASEVASDLKNLRFQMEDVSRLSFAEGTFDVIISRYVIQHVDRDSRLRALREFHRCLRVGGNLAIIDFDGSFFNIYPQTPLMKKVIELYEEHGPVDLRIGRKLPLMLREAGFAEVTWKIETIECQGEDLDREVEMVEQKLAATMKPLGQFLGSEVEAKKFKAEYLQTMKQPGTVLFYNKFIVTGRKTGGRHLSIVRR